MAESQIVIRDLILHGFHGVYPQEAVTGTEFKISAVIDIDPGLQGFYTDDVNDTVNYEIISARIVEIVCNRRFNLLERLCQVLCEELLNIDGIIKVDITVEKYLTSLTDRPQWFGIRRVIGREDSAN